MRALVNLWCVCTDSSPQGERGGKTWKNIWVLSHMGKDNNQQPSLHLPVASLEGGWAGPNLYPPWQMLLGVKMNSLWICLGFMSESSVASRGLTRTAAGEDERQSWGWDTYAKGACYPLGELKLGWFCKGKNECMMEQYEWAVVLKEVWWKMHTDTSVTFQVLGRKEEGSLQAFISVLSVCH